MEIREGYVQETIKEMGTRIREILEKMEKKGGRAGRYMGRGWWNEECAEEKRMVRRALRK